MNVFMISWMDEWSNEWEFDSGQWTSKCMNERDEWMNWHEWVDQWTVKWMNKLMS